MFEFHSPSSLEEVMDCIAPESANAKVVAGGTALVLLLNHQLVDLDLLVNLQHVNDQPFRTISREGEWLRIGGGVTLTDLAASPWVTDGFNSLWSACSQVGNLRIRNSATLAGNLAEADYASDPPAVLASLGAVCVIQSRRGTRRVPCSQFFLGYMQSVLRHDEIVVAVEVPLAVEGATAKYTKLSSRSMADRPCVGVATRLQLDAGRLVDIDVVVGAVAQTPQRLTDLLDRFKGQPFGTPDVDLIADGYANQIDAISDGRGSGTYRRKVVRALVRRDLQALLHTEAG